MKIAKYKRIDEIGDWEQVIEARDYMEDSETWVRLTEVMEVEFTYLPPEQTVQKQVDALNEQKENERVRHMEVLAGFDERISKLQAITYKAA